MGQAFAAGDLQNLQLAAFDPEQRVEPGAEFFAREMVFALLAEITHRAGQIAAIRHFDQSGANMLAMGIAPAAIVAAVAVERGDRCEHLSGYVEGLVEEAPRILGDLHCGVSVLRADLVEEDVFAAGAPSCRYGGKAHGTQRLRVVGHDLRAPKAWVY